MLMTGCGQGRSAAPGAARRLLRALPLVLTATVALAMASLTTAAAKPRVRSGGLLFNGAFTPGTLRPWSDLSLSDRMAPLRSRVEGATVARLARQSQLINVVRPVGRQSRLWAARFTVTPQRQWLEGTSYMERTEVMASPAQTGAYAGRNVWYGWATYFPRGFVATPHHYTVIAQVHSAGDACPPPNLYVVVNTEAARQSAPDLHAIQLITYGGSTAAAPYTGTAGSCLGAQSHKFVVAQFRARHWFRFVMHVMWSGDPYAGYVELWVDGRLAVPRTHLPTLYASTPAYWKQGLYEFASSYAASDYELGVRVGSSYAAVAY